jgi:hypothetical protein
MFAKFYQLFLILILSISCSSKKQTNNPMTIAKEGITKEIVIVSKKVLEQFYPFGDYPYSNSLFSLNYRLQGKIHTPVTNGVIYDDEINVGCCVSLRLNQPKNKIYIIGLKHILLIEANGLKHTLSERVVKDWAIKREEISYGMGFNSMAEVIDLDKTWENATESGEILKEINQLL